MENLLRKEFEDTYFADISTTKGIFSLAKKIGISYNSLRRFLGKLNDGTHLRISTLNLISESLGYSDFKDFFENYDNKNQSIDFSVLEIFYGSVKGKGIIMGEERFQNVNYEFAEKIIQNPKNLKSFLKHFRDNNEAMEYVLAWHPTYGKIADKEYQNALLKMAKLTNISHIKVYAQSFVFFGKFLSESLTFDEAEKDIQYLRKSVIQMRKNYDFFWSFPEVRYRIAELLYHFIRKENALLNTEIKKFCVDDYPQIPAECRFVYSLYLADCLNLIGRYEDADFLQQKLIENHWSVDFENRNYHSETHILFSKISRAITLFHIKNRKESEELFSEISEELSENGKLPFDIKDYFELQYYYLGKKLFAENKSFNQKFEQMILKTKFTFFRTL